MNAVEQHKHTPDTTLDGGSLDCGGGLLLLIRRAIDPLPPGGLLEILSTEPTVEVELPAWSRMTGNELVSWTKSRRLAVQLPWSARARSQAGLTAWHRTEPSTGRAAKARGSLQYQRIPARPVARANYRPSLRHGHRQLAATILDAAVNP